MDIVREQLEKAQADIQTSHGEFERKAPQSQDKASVRAHKKGGRDSVRRASKEYQEQVQRATVTYIGKGKPKKGGAAKAAHAKRVKPTPTIRTGTGGWVFEGTYGTRAEAEVVRKGYRRSGYFVTVRRLSGAGYSVWIKPMGAVDVKWAKMLKGGKEQKGVVTRTLETTGRTVGSLTSLGSLPEYQPPDFKVAKSGYTPLQYKQTQVGKYQPMTYQPVSTEPMFRSFQPYKPIRNEPYYRKSEYVPIGEFGVRGNWAKKHKKRKKLKQVRLAGVK